jgi:hypothetical protein
MQTRLKFCIKKKDIYNLLKKKLINICSVVLAVTLRTKRLREFSCLYRF